MHSCWVSYGNYPSAIEKKESKGSTAGTVEVDNVRDLKKEPSSLSFSTLQWKLLAGNVGGDPHFGPSRTRLFSLYET